MNEPAAPDERPPYWSDCENKNLPRLGLFIHDALERRKEQEVPTDGSIPLSRREFMDLVNLMQAKADDQKEDTTTPPRPVYDGPPAPPPFPDATELLRVAHRRRNEARERIASAIKFRAGQNLIRQRREEVRKAEEAVSQVQAEADRRKEEILELRREYWQAREPYERSLSTWEGQVAKAKRRREANEKRQALVDRAPQGRERLYVQARSRYPCAYHPRLRVRSPRPADRRARARVLPGGDPPRPAQRSFLGGPSRQGARAPLENLGEGQGRFVRLHPPHVPPHGEGPHGVPD